MSLLTSINEGWPNVVGEAMACGVPCVAFDVGDIKSIIVPEQFVISPGENQLFANIVCDILRMSPDEVTHLSRFQRHYQGEI